MTRTVGRIWSKAKRKDPAFRAERRAYSAKWKRDNYARVREQAGITGITRPEPDNCECCGIDRIFIVRGLHCDHDHDTGAFRGWLCGKCNAGIGMLGDSRRGLALADRYLKRSE